MPRAAAYLGPVASFSHQAAKEYSDPSTDLVPKHSFTDVFSAVQSSEVDYGVVPFENSSNGSVIQSLDLLADRQRLYSDIKVCDEHYLTVHHCLLVKNEEEVDPAKGLRNIKKLYTHPQAWGQCESYLSSHFKGIERQDVSSTSKAAQIVSEDESRSSAAIASSLAASIYGLKTLAYSIEDRGDNTTRFFIIQKPSEDVTNNENGEHQETHTKSQQPQNARWKSLISFTIDHGIPGALADGLTVFKKHGLNLTSIDTRPSRRVPWHYIFFVECQVLNSVGRHGESVDSALGELKTLTQECRHLGTWKDRMGGEMFKETRNY
ncbi:MAG: hypothetical protein Q9227_007554 [Pyrenula ochraceoflavens]